MNTPLYLLRIMVQTLRDPPNPKEAPNQRDVGYEVDGIIIMQHIVLSKELKVHPKGDKSNYKM